GVIGVGAGIATSSVITSNSAGSNGVTINVGGINTITETVSSNGGQITITATEVDGSTSNELQTLSLSSGNLSISNGNSIPVTLIAPVQNITAGSGISVSQGGGGVFTITNTATVNTGSTISGNGTIGNPLQIAQMGAAADQSMRWNGSTWTPTTGYFISASGDITSTPLQGTGDRVIIANSSGSLIRSALDPANLFQRPAAYGATGTSNVLIYNGSNWSAGRENGNFGLKEPFGSFITFDQAAGTGKEGWSYVYNSAGGGTAISDQPTSGIHGYYSYTVGIGSNISTLDHCMQVAYGQPATGIENREWRRYRVSGTWQAWIDVTPGAALPTGASFGDVVRWNGSAWTASPERNTGANTTVVGAGGGTTYDVIENSVRHIIADAASGNVEVRFSGDELDGARWFIYCTNTAATRFVFVTAANVMTSIRRANNFSSNLGVTYSVNTNILIEVTKIGSILYINTVSQ
ncbi:MAG: hypothetical protein ACRC1D_09380, partial [Culicoidibacterales bacterium]